METFGPSIILFGISYVPGPGAKSNSFNGFLFAEPILTIAEDGLATSCLFSYYPGPGT